MLLLIPALNVRFVTDHLASFYRTAEETVETHRSAGNVFFFLTIISPRRRCGSQTSVKESGAPDPGVIGVMEPGARGVCWCNTQLQT